ncbi:MAG TPA: glycine zipper 2TM domain-containing protein [Methylibium sp.]|uniref:glycine zipper 2TM domain-containing protein n=1 Tax=Methylibium sp. TaxID=2067992 RepID=UPI002DBD30C8|nr:glycine zipper 2TM domain-containing protein [Methylibium sp.]HEU4458951.1 glycine zipper 2TM domain-containing protein [Methylibium sp.]
MEASLDEKSPQPAAGAAPKWIWMAGGAVALTAAGIAAALTQAQRAPASVAPPAAATAPAAPLDLPESKLAKAETPPAPRARAQAEATPRDEAPPSPICTNCGVVESVQAVKVKGEGSGIGAVAGGVIGGVVGNQFGSGNGRKAMTVVGAVGGGFAGHEVEKQVKAKTVYSVKLRMDDGTLRTVQQAQAPAVGARFKLDGTQLRPV